MKTRRAGVPLLTICLTVVFIIIIMNIMVVTLQAQKLTARSGAPGGLAATAVNEIELPVGKSVVLNTDAPIKRVSLTTPDIADALVMAPQQVLIHGKAPGTISLFVWGTAGGITGYDIVVRRDLSELEERMSQLFPGEPITVASNGTDVVISGTVSTKYVVDKAAAVTAGYVESEENVVNLLRQQEGVASDQVMLRVRFAEVSRTAMQELGASFFTDIAGAGDWIGRLTTQQFAAPNFNGPNQQQFGNGEGFIFSDFLNLLAFNSSAHLGIVIRALQTRGLFQSLAEPNLITQNGREASFLAGGEYPYPVVQGSNLNAAVTILFKEFGVRLRFTPTIVGEDLVHIKVAPEVSALDFSNAITLAGFRIPALLTRRTETEVELRDGQTFAIAGLIDSSLTETSRKIPGLGDIPILGRLFRSRAYQRNETELIVMITPHILRRDSVGVAAQLPDLVKPFMDPPARTLSPPPPAFAPPANGAAGSPTTSQQQAAQLGSLPAASRQLTREQAEERERAAEAERKRLEEERKRAAQERDAQEKAARAWAKREAEAARVAAEAERKRLEEERKRAAQERDAQEKTARAWAAREEAREAAKAEQERLEQERLEEERKQAERERKEQEGLASVLNWSEELQRLVRARAKREAEEAKLAAQVEQKR